MTTQIYRCVACNRTVTRPALTIPSRSGLLVWGSTCARRVSATRTPSRSGQTRDAVTRDMFEAAT